MPKRDIPPIEDDLIILRLLDISDLALTLSWRNQPFIRKWFVHSEVISKEKHLTWFQQYIELDNDFVFLILAKVVGQITPVGQASLYNIDWNSGTAEYGRLMIGEPSAMGRGYARRATGLLLKFGCEQMGLSMFSLEVKSNNAPAISLYNSTGFITTGQRNDLITMVFSK